MSSQARNLRYANNTLRHVYHDTQITVKQNAKLEELLMAQKEENRKLNSFVNSKIPDLSKIFPLKDSAALEEFLDDSDARLYDLRRAELPNYIDPCVGLKQNLFSTALMRMLFSPNFIINHSWPSNR